MKTSKSSSAIKITKKDYKKMLVKDINIFLKKKKEKNMVVNDRNIYQKIRNKSWLSIEKYCKTRKKSLIIIIRNDFLFDRFFDRLFF